MSLKPYYQDKYATIYHGDCLNVFPLLKEKFSAVITDPPYAIPTQVAQGRTQTRNIGDLSIVEAGMRVIFNSCDKALQVGARYFVFCDGTSYPVISRVFYGKFTTALLVWDKGRIGMGREFRKQHELILHAWKKDTPVVSSNGTGYPDILKASPVKSKRLYDAQKPVDLVVQLLRVCGDSILDPFMGSGTMLVSSKRLKRKSVGIEINEEVCEIAAKRLSQEVLEF